MSYKELYFGDQIDTHWNLLEVLDENKQPTDLIAVRGEFWTPESEAKFNELVKTKKVIGLSSYQCFPRYINNPHEHRGPTKYEDAFINKYGNYVILWCHCFKDSFNYLPSSIPRILYSETDQYPNVAWLNSQAKTVEKKYDFFASIQDGEWNSWIRGVDIAKTWLNFMADKMNLKILVCGSNRRNDFSKKIDVIDFQPWGEFIKKMNSAKYLFCSSRYDASPRLVIEALALGMPVLLNENILGGWKYINNRTGMFFFQDESIETKVTHFLKQKDRYDTIKWLNKNFDLKANVEFFSTSVNILANLNYKDFIDGIMYINLKNRTDRDKQINDELARVGVPTDMIYRIDAVYNKTCGHLGCAMSHLKCLSFAKQKGWKKFLILEDDFVFNLPKERILYMLSIFYKKIKKWDVLMMATYWNENDDTKYDFIKKVIYGTTTSGYIVTSEYADALYNNFMNSFKLLDDEVNKFKVSNPGKKLFETKYAIDQQWFSLQKANKFYITEPRIGRQSDSISSIMSQQIS
jgi:glycosyl transferase family 25